MTLFKRDNHILHGNQGSPYPVVTTKPAYYSPCWVILIPSARPVWPCMLCKCPAPTSSEYVTNKLLPVSSVHCGVMYSAIALFRKGIPPPQTGWTGGDQSKIELQRKLIKAILTQIVKGLSLFILHHVPQVILIWPMFENHCIILFRLLGSYLNVQGHLGSQGQGYAWLKPPGYQLSIVRCPQRSKNDL